MRILFFFFFFCKQKTAYEMRISDWRSDVCSSDLREGSWAYFRLAHEGAPADLARTLVDALPADDPTVLRDLRRLDEVMGERARRAEDYFRQVADRWDELRALYVHDDDVERQLAALIAEIGRASCRERVCQYG